MKRLLPFILLLNLVSIATAGKLLAISDLHFEPFSQCDSQPCQLITQLQTKPISKWPKLFSQSKTSSHSDSHYRLIKNALKAAQQQKSDSVIVLGDLLTHQFKRKFFYYSSIKTDEAYTKFVEKVLRFLTTEIRNTFPNEPIYMTFGNNDTIHGDYLTDSKGQLFKDMSHVENKSNWLRLAKLKGENPSFNEGGYYAASMKNKKIRILSLNTNLFSALAGDTQKKANKQLDWLERELKKAEHDKKTVWLMMHIPQGIDVYKSLYSIGTNVFWQESYSKRYLKILEQYQNTIAIIFSGHVHMDGWTFYPFNKKTIINLSTPSISPRFGNNPAFKIYDYNQAGYIYDYKTFYLNLDETQPSWALLYQYSDIYKNKLTEKLPQTPRGKNQILNYWFRYVVRGNSLLTQQSYFSPYYACAMRHHMPEDWQACLNNQ